MKKIIRNILIAVISIISILILTLVIIFFNFPGVMIYFNNQMNRSGADLKLHELKIGDQKWVYLDNSLQNKEILVFIHGFGLNKDFWGKLPKSFSGDYRIIIPDIPGFGESGKPDGDYDLLTQVGRFEKFIGALNLNRFSLIGFSMGGAISCEYCANNPEKVAKLILIDSYGAANVESEFDKYFRQTGTNLLLFRTPEEYRQLLKYSMFKPQNVPGQFLKFYSDYNTGNYELNKKLFTGLTKYGNDILIKDLSKITAPALIIWGRDDKLIDPAAAENFHRDIKNSKIIIVDEAGHMVYAEKPENVIEAIKKFL